MVVNVVQPEDLVPLNNKINAVDAKVDTLSNTVASQASAISAISAQASAANQKADAAAIKANDAITIANAAIVSVNQLETKVDAGLVEISNDIEIVDNKVDEALVKIQQIQDTLDGGIIVVPPTPVILPIISATSVIVSEEAGKATVVFQLDKVAPDNVSFKISTVSGTALGGSDFNPLLNVALGIAKGQSSVSTDVFFINDNVPESEEVFQVVVTDIVNANAIASVKSVTIKITDSDVVIQPPPNGTDPAVTPTPITAVPFDYQKVFVGPVVKQNGNIVTEAGGIINLTFAVRDYPYAPFSGHKVTKIKYYLDEQPISGVVDVSTPVSFDLSNIPDGQHAFAAELVDGTELYQHRSESISFIVANNSANTGPQDLVVTGHAFISSRYMSNRLDKIRWPGGTNRLINNDPSYVTEFAPPVNGDAAYRSDSKWFLEPLSHAKVGLYNPLPKVFLSKSGRIVYHHGNFQHGDNATDATPTARKRDLYVGKRNNHQLTPYSTASARLDGPGIWLIDLTGAVMSLDLTGELKFVAGRKKKTDKIPLDYSDAKFTAADFDAEYEWVGTWTDGKIGLNGPHDIIQRKTNKNILVIADSFNHRILELDLTNPAAPVFKTLAGIFGQGGLVDGPAAQSKFYKPYSVEETADGSIIVACTAEDSGQYSAIRKIAPDGTVSTVIPIGVQGADENVWRPFVAKLDSQGNIVVGEHLTGKLKKFTPTGTLIWSKSVIKANWIWIAVDVKGNIGPVDDIFHLPATGGNGNKDVHRFTTDGTDLGMSFQGGFGRASHGIGTYTNEPCSHYPWLVCIDDEEARVWFYGFGDVGIGSLRRIKANDPVETYDYNTYSIGAGIYQTGSVLGYYGLRPSFGALRGWSGFSPANIVPNFDALANKTDDELIAYAQAGLGGSVPRPEISGYLAKCLVYFMRYNMYPYKTTALAAPIPPTSAQKVKPAIKSLTAIKNADGSATFTWATDKVAFGVVSAGQANGQYYVCKCSTVGTNHSVTIPDCPTHFVVDVIDNFGNRQQTVDQVLS